MAPNGPIFTIKTLLAQYIYNISPNLSNGAVRRVTGLDLMNLFEDKQIVVERCVCLCES